MLNENNLFNRTNWKPFAQLKEKINFKEKFSDYEILQLAWYLNNWHKNEENSDGLTDLQIVETFLDFVNMFSDDMWKLHSMSAQQAVISTNAAAEAGLLELQTIREDDLSFLEEPEPQLN